MGLVRALLTLPVKGPVQSGLWVARKVHETAEVEFNDPAALRKMLVSLEQQLLNGDISEAAYDKAETEILMRLRGLR